MTFELPKKISDRLDEVARLCEDANKALPMINNTRNSHDVQHQVLFILLVRAIKYLDAYLFLARAGYGEPAISLVRSIYEASLWMRWSSKSKSNAEKYFDASKGESIRMANKLVSRNLARFTGPGNQKDFQEMLQDELAKTKFPTWEQLAAEVGQQDLHALIYPLLSAMSHGTLMSMGERLVKDKTLSPGPDSDNILPYISIANNVFNDCYLVCGEWVVNGKLRPVPDTRKLMKQESFPKRRETFPQDTEG